ADARARTRDVVAAVDGLDRGCVTAMDRTIAAVGLHHRWGEPSDSVFPPGSQTDAAPTMPQPTAEVGMGDRLLSCERIHLQASGGGSWWVKSGSNTTRPTTTCENGFAFWIIVSTVATTCQLAAGGPRRRARRC